MSSISAINRIRCGGEDRLRFPQHVKSFFLRVFFKGPKAFFSSQITGVCGALMILLCLPSLLYCALLTLPGILFYSPEQHAYYYFSRILNEDPSRWIIMSVAILCTMLALALPATMPAKVNSSDD